MRAAGLLTILCAVAFFNLTGQVSAQVPPANPTPPLFPDAPVPLVASAPDGSTASSRFTATVEFLYLWPNREGLGMAVVSAPGSGVTYNSLESLSWDGTPAFRIGGRYDLPDSDTDIRAEFMYFHAKTQRTVTAPDGGSLAGLLATDHSAKDATAADGDAGLSYAVLDLDVGQSARINDALQVRAFGGVRLASINQSLKSIYSGGALGDASDFVNSPIRFYGAGLTAGGEAVWNFYRGWGIYGKGRLGLISGSFDSKRTETVGTTLIDDETDKYYTVVSVAELGAGVSYRGDRFFLRAGYEMTDWMNMVSGSGTLSSTGNTARKRGNLTLESFTVKFGFDF